MKFFDEAIKLYSKICQSSLRDPVLKMALTPYKMVTLPPSPKIPAKPVDVVG